MATKAIVMVTLTADGVSAHDQTVRQAILDNSNLQSSEVKYSSELPVSNSIQTVIDYGASIGAIIVRPYSSGYIIQSLYNTRYPQTLIVNAMENDAGTNAHTENTRLSSLGSVVFVGAGKSGATENQTAYGFGLEFWDVETYGNPSTAESSYATGVIAGKLYSIKSALDCSWDDARMVARSTASGNGNWSKFNGYGVINVDRAIASPTDNTPRFKPESVSPLRGNKIGSRYLPDLIK